MMVGRRFGRLEVRERAGSNERRYAQWLCCCDCGRSVVVTGNRLRSGNTQSCGCSRGTIRNGDRSHPLYGLWKRTLQRCNNPKASKYEYYGGRGIKMWDGWATDFTRFSRDIGDRPSPSHTLDRIDNDRGYEPGNVRWATWKQQASNRRKPYTQTQVAALEREIERLQKENEDLRDRLARSKHDSGVQEW